MHMIINIVVNTHRYHRVTTRGVYSSTYGRKKRASPKSHTCCGQPVGMLCDSHASRPHPHNAAVVEQQVAELEVPVLDPVVV